MVVLWQDRASKVSINSVGATLNNMVVLNLSKILFICWDFSGSGWEPLNQNRIPFEVLAGGSLFVRLLEGWKYEPGPVLSHGSLNTNTLLEEWAKGWRKFFFSWVGESNFNVSVLNQVEIQLHYQFHEYYLTCKTCNVITAQKSCPLLN